MIYFIQPAVPKYRVPFFNELSRNDKMPEFQVYTSSRDFAGVNTAVENIEFDLKIRGFFKKLGGIYIHKELNFPKLNKKDILVISGNPRVINIMYLFFICKLKGIKVVWWGQGWTAGRRGLMSKIRHQLMKLSDLVILYTDKELGIFSDKINVVALNNGLDISEINNAKLKLGNIIKKENNLNLLYIGRLTEKSDLALLYQALCHVKRKIILHIIGDGELRNEIQKKFSQLPHEVIFYGAIYDEIDIAKVALECHAFVYPGAVGLSLIHAFAYGIPAILHDNYDHHMPEIAAFNERFNGVTYKYNNILSFAKVLESVSIEELNTFGANALKTVENSFNTHDMANRFTAAILEIEQ